MKFTFDAKDLVSFSFLDAKVTRQNKRFATSFFPKPTVKGALSGLILFFATGSPLKMMKNAFYFTLTALFVVKIFNFLS